MYKYKTSYVTGIEYDTREIDYQNWRGNQWSVYSKEIMRNNGIVDGLNIVWNKWKSDSNPYKNLFLTKEQFLLGLAQSERMPDVYKAAVEGIGTTYTITYASVPVYDTWTNWWYGIDAWNCQNWMDYFTALKGHYGESSARSMWNNAAQHPDNSYTMGAFHTCLSDCDFYRFQVQNQLWRPALPITGAITWLSCDLGSVVTNTTNTVSNVAQGVASVGNMLKILIPVIAGFGTYYLYRTYIKDGKKKK